VINYWSDLLHFGGDACQPSNRQRVSQSSLLQSCVVFVGLCVIKSLCSRVCHQGFPLENYSAELTSINKLVSPRLACTAGILCCGLHFGLWAAVCEV